MAEFDGTEGNDILSGTSENDGIFGFSGNDSLYGYLGEDYLDAGSGNDTLNGGTGSDTLNGGSGSDTFAVITYSDDLDPLTAGKTDYALIKDFNPQQDFIQLEGAKINYFLGASPDSLPKGTAIFFDKPGSELDELIAIVEKKSALNLNDSYFTTTVDDIFVGTSSGDRFNSGIGDDSLFGKQGNDSLTGGNGNDFFSGDDGNDLLIGSNGSDTLYGINGNDFLIGGNGNDTLYGANDWLDSFYSESFTTDGTGEIDTLTGGVGRDKFVLGNIIFDRGGASEPFIYYDDNNTKAAGRTDYALIQDFNSSQDVIQLLGTAANYSLGSSSGSLPAGTGIYLDKPNTEPDELIGIVKGVSSSSLSLTASYFNYVT